MSAPNPKQQFSSLLLVLAPLVNACTLPGCDHPDCGSCGGACCNLSVVIPESTESVMTKLKTVLEKKGPDGLYTPMPTAEGTLTFGDLRQYNAAVDFIGQAWHTTINGMYNDTINFSLANEVLSPEKNGTRINAFSISQLAGSFCDAGQNHWNIVQLIQATGWEGLSADELVFEHVGESCPEPKKK